MVASGSSDGTIALSGVSDGKLVMRLPLSSDPNVAASSVPVAALAFSSGSRYLCSAAGSVVTIWDLKKHEKSRRLTGHTGSVTCLDFGQGDAHVASASDRGEILVHNLLVASMAVKLTSAAAALGSAGAALRDVQHSPHKKHLLGVCGDAGVVELWDCNTSSLYASLRPPTLAGASSAGGPLSALRFSPTSNALFASVGLDKRLCFYDVNSKKSVENDAQHGRALISLSTESVCWVGLTRSLFVVPFFLCPDAFATSARIIL